MLYFSLKIVIDRWLKTIRIDGKMLQNFIWTNYIIIWYHIMKHAFAIENRLRWERVTWHGKRNAFAWINWAFVQCSFYIFFTLFTYNRLKASSRCQKCVSNFPALQWFYYRMKIKKKSDGCVYKWARVKEKKRQTNKWKRSQNQNYSWKMHGNQSNCWKLMIKKQTMWKQLFMVNEWAHRASESATASNQSGNVYASSLL